MADEIKAMNSIFLGSRYRQRARKGVNILLRSLGIPQKPPVLFTGGTELECKHGTLFNTLYGAE
jgi:hypothetical protein